MKAQDNSQVRNDMLNHSHINYEHISVQNIYTSITKVNYRVIVYSIINQCMRYTSSYIELLRQWMSETLVLGVVLCNRSFRLCNFKHLIDLDSYHMCQAFKLESDNYHICIQ